MLFELTENLFFCEQTDELNKGELGSLSEVIVTVENILPQQTKFAKGKIVFNYDFNRQTMNIYNEISVKFSLLLKV